MFKKHNISTPIAFVINMIMAYVAYMLCRIEYVAENWSAIGTSLFSNPLQDLLSGSLKFDTSAILYTNMLYALMMLIPLHYKGSRIWQKIAKWVFVVINSIAIVVNLADSVYFRYTGKRTTMGVLQEFENEGNMGSILGTEVINHWYLFLLGIVMICLLWRLYVTPSSRGRKKHNYILYYAANILIFALYIPLTIAGMRGGFTHAVRPITISNANQYVNHPTEAAVILNTPFSLIRTLGKQTFKVPEYEICEIDNGYSAVHIPATNATPNKKNIVILIVESLGKEYVEKGYAPFVHRLEERSLTFQHSYANGRKSIDGMPSILSSIPMFVEPFFLTPASLNDLSGIAGEVKKIGYQTAFFHGAENGSMGFMAFAHTTGFDNYYGKTEYCEDNRFNGNDDFDGTWAIWDEQFLQFYALKMNEMKQPFMTAVFTASSHHPFNIPDVYKEQYKEEGNNPIHKCIRYTDMSIKKFFETARKQSWYNNTIFVITCDHTNGSDSPEYATDWGIYSAPIIIYDPSATTLKPQRRNAIAQQIDIMPTVLSAIGYNKPYIAFGQDLLSTTDENTWAVNYNNGTYQFFHGNTLLQYDGEKVVGYYDIIHDPLLKHNLSNTVTSSHSDLKYLKAIIYDYMQRMTSNTLVFKK